MDQEEEKDQLSEEVLTGAEVQDQAIVAAIAETDRLLVDVERQSAAVMAENQHLQQKIDGEIAAIQDDLDEALVDFVKATEDEE